MSASTLAPPVSPGSVAARPFWRVFKPAAKDAAPIAGTPYPLQFTGDGRTYFRFWLVNVLLAVVTLGLYKPLARRRTAQYFYEHTLVAGSPLTFTASKRSMVVGFLIALLLGIVWRVGRLSGLDALVALSFVGMALWTPFVWASALRFRLGNTRWRGLRLRFAARWSQVYRAYWPAFAQGLVVLAVLVAGWALAPFDTRGVLDLSIWLGGLFAQNRELTAAMQIVLLAGLLLLFLLAIVLDCTLRDLRVRHTRLGVQCAGWQRPSLFTFAKIWTVALLLILLLPGLLYWGLEEGLMLIFGSDTQAWEKGNKHPLFFVSALIGVVLFILLMIVASSPARAYYHARMFRLMWSRLVVRHGEDGSVLARFGCTLRTGAWVRLRFKNALLRLLTLGFYGPLATLAEYRMKLESVTLFVEDGGDLDQLVGELTRSQSGALGDALADVAGMELIG